MADGAVLGDLGEKQFPAAGIIHHFLSGCLHRGQMENVDVGGFQRVNWDAEAAAAAAAAAAQAFLQLPVPTCSV